MRHASSRSIYLSLHTLLSVLVRAVRGAPTTHVPDLLSKRALAEDLSTGQVVGYVVFIVMLIVLSGVTAGLTLGLMSLDETQRTAKQKRHAAKIIPIRKNGHLLLVSLLLMNVFSNETLPVISEKVFDSGLASVAISTVLIVIFAEILPQAICSTHGLAIGAAMAVPVKIAIVLMFVVAWPTAKLLDLILGENHGMVYRRAELKELIDFHSKQAQHGGDLSIDAVTIMRGALDLQEKKVSNSMTYIDDVFMLHSDTRLDRQTIQRIVNSGHSRIPIYDIVDDEASVADFNAGLSSEIAQRRKIIGCLLAKNLLLIDPDDDVPLSKVSINHIPSVQDDLPLFDILNTFQEGRSHLAVVVKSPVAPLTQLSSHRSGSRSSTDTVVEDTGIPHLWTDEEMSQLEPLGIITLEDVLEELIQEPIWDETDTTERPRAGLAVPLQGTGESLILATSRGRGRGRPVSRHVSSSERPAADQGLFPKSKSGAIESSYDLRSADQVEMINLQRAMPEGAEVAGYQLSRSNSIAPNDAKLQSFGVDPFTLGGISRSSTMQSREDQSPSVVANNKLLNLVKPSRPLSVGLPTRAVPAFEKNRFKSRSTSSSATRGNRRAQSAHTPLARETSNPFVSRLDAQGLLDENHLRDDEVDRLSASTNDIGK